MSVAINGGAFGVGGVVRIGLRNEEEAGGFVMGIKVTVLETATADKRVGTVLPNLLRLGCVDFHVAAVTERDGVLIDIQKSAIGIVIPIDHRLRGIGEAEGILQTTSEEQCVTLRSPF